MVRVVSGAMLVALGAAASCGGKSAHDVTARHGGGGKAGTAATAGSAGVPAAGSSSRGGRGGNPAVEPGAGESGSGNAGVAAGTGGATAGTSGSASGGGGSAAAAGGSDGGSQASAGESAGGAAAGDAGRGGESGGADPGVTFPPRGVCGTTYPPNEVKCEGLAQVLITAGPLLDAGGDPDISAGEDAKVTFTLHNTATEAFDAPCVGLLADTPWVTEIQGDSGNFNPWPKYFSILANQSLTFPAHFHLDASAVPGTTIHLVAWVTLQTAGCANGRDVAFSFEVAP